MFVVHDIHLFFKKNKKLHPSQSPVISKMTTVEKRKFMLSNPKPPESPVPPQSPVIQVINNFLNNTFYTSSTYI